MRRLVRITMRLTADYVHLVEAVDEGAGWKPIQGRASP